MGKFFTGTQPLAGDKNNDLLAKILQQLDGTPESGDANNKLLQRILIQLGGNPAPGDYDNSLLAKILIQLGGVPRPGDVTHVLLAKILDQLGGTRRPGNSKNKLLREILEALRGQNQGFSFIIRAEIINGTQASAIDALVTAAKAHGWWDKCEAIYPFVGGTAAAHAENLKSSDFRITWHGTVTHNANGITGDNSTGYGDTGLNPAGELLHDSAHIGVYRRTTGTSSVRMYLGAQNSSSQHRLQLFRPVTATSVSAAANSTFGTFASTALAWMAISRLQASEMLFLNASAATASPAASVARPAVNLLLLANNNNGTPASFSNANLAGATIGAGITLAEYLLMEADWQDFQTALGRQV